MRSLRGSGVNDGTARTLTLRLDFLDAGRERHRDDSPGRRGRSYLTDARHRIVCETIRVNKGDTYKLWLAPGGGAAMRLHPGK